MKKRILSGMRPTGPLHLGHMVGALKNWVRLQDEYDCYYMVADWHALMSEYEDPKAIRENTINIAAEWVSCGIDPEKCAIFVQSEVPYHLDLYMALSCLTPLSWLERCPTYKEQLREIKKRDLTTFAFLGYPVLQAADILLYKAQAVPVGIDQSAHLELTREIARRFNSLYGNVFPEPQTLLTESPKLLGIDNRKMSKTYENFIALADAPKEIAEKTKKMFTDPERIYRHDKGHPDKCNIYSYFGVFEPAKTRELHSMCAKAELGCVDCKKKLAEMLVEMLKPIQKTRSSLLDDKKQILDILKKGKEKALDFAAKTMAEVRGKVGLIIRE